MFIFGPSGIAAKAKWRDAASDDRRSACRVLVALGVSYVSAEGHVRYATTIEISPDEASIISKHRPAIGEHLALDVEGFGRFRGTVNRYLLDGFALRFFELPSSRSLLTEALATRVRHDQEPGTSEDLRTERRIKPASRIVVLRFDRQDFTARVRDLSPSAAAFTSSAKLRVNERARLGSMAGTIIRTFGNGAVIRFDRSIDAEDFDEDIIF